MFDRLTTKLISNRYSNANSAHQTQTINPQRHSIQSIATPISIIRIVKLQLIVLTFYERNGVLFYLSMPKFPRKSLLHSKQDAGRIKSDRIRKSLHRQIYAVVKADLYLKRRRVKPSRLTDVPAKQLQTHRELHDKLLSAWTLCFVFYLTNCLSGPEFMI